MHRDSSWNNMLFAQENQQLEPNIYYYSWKRKKKSLQDSLDGRESGCKDVTYKTLLYFK